MTAAAFVRIPFIRGVISSMAEISKDRNVGCTLVAFMRREGVQRRPSYARREGRGAISPPRRASRRDDAARASAQALALRGGAKVLLLLGGATTASGSR